MAGTMRVEGVEELSSMLQDLGKAAPGIAAASLYEGAGIMAGSIWNAIESVQTAPFKYAKGGETRLPSPEEKAALMSGEYGIAKFDKNGSEVTTSVGYDASGYVDVNFNHMSSSARTNYKSSGQSQKPVGVIANAINSGTSFMKKQPFFRKGVSAGKGPAQAAIIAKAEEIVETITNK